MKYWIITASRDHVESGINGQFAQACHGKLNPLKRIKQGDWVIYYSSKEFFDKPTKYQKFTAIGKVKDDNPYQIEITKDFCPFRIDIDFKDAEHISILPLIDSLEFIQNKQKWGYPFRWGILEIKKNDFDLISNLMLKEKVS